MAPPGQHDPFIQLLSRSRVPFAVVTGTTAATLNAAATVAHGLRGPQGQTLAAAPRVAIAFPTSAAGGVYQGAAPTTTVIDIRSAAASVPYVAIVIV